MPGHSSRYGGLDRVRTDEGIEACRALFGDTWRRNKRKAVLWLNDRDFTFPCLYILYPQIESYHLSRCLNWRNAIGLRLIREVQSPANDRHPDFLSDKNTAEHAALRWMLETGREADGLTDEYEAIMEIAASVLTGVYRDTRVLPLVSDMIFARGRGGHNIHDLAWAFFRIHDPYALRLVAERIHSTDRRDAELACRLLHIEAPQAGIADTRTSYESYLKWLADNDPFLYFTGESMYLTSAPSVCDIDLERKYLHRGAPSYERQPVIPSDEDESARLDDFRSLHDEEKAILAEYSSRLYTADTAEWEKWMARPVKEQINAARGAGMAW